jgi:hypothetical protein
MFMTPHPSGKLTDGDQEIKGNPEVDAYALLMQTVHEAMAQGRFRPDLASADLIAQTLWSAVHGVISLDIAKKNDEWVEWQPFEERQETMLDTILRGMLKESN